MHRMGLHAQDRDDDVWSQWASAWQGVAYRFLGAHRDSEMAAASLGQPGGDAPAAPERVRQEHAIYGFFASSLSAIECFAFAMYALGHWLEPDGFPFSNGDRDSVTLAQTRRTFTQYFPRDEVSDRLSRVSGTSDLRDWRKIRNILSHRAAPGRAISRTIGLADITHAGWLDITLSPNFILGRRAWLGDALGQLVDGAAAFCASRF